MIKIDSHTDIDLDQLALSHFLNLIQPQNIDGTFHATQSLVGRIRKQRRKDMCFPRRVRFWNYFLDNMWENLQKSIVGRPNIIAQIIEDIEGLIGHDLLSNHIDDNQATLTMFGKSVQKVFGYENYRSKDCSKENVEKFSINYCPYCNIHKLESIVLINGLTGDKKKAALFQLDHFYPRSRYPYLSVSFFNLIPGCGPCNAHLKLEKNFKISTHINPFHLSFNDYFQFELSSVIYNSAEDVVVNLNNKNEFARNIIEDLNLETRYRDKNTKKKTFELIQSWKNRSPATINSMKSQIVGLFGRLENTDSTLLTSQGVPVEKNEISNYEMGKLKRDICIQLELLQD